MKKQTFCDRSWIPKGFSRLSPDMVSPAKRFEAVEKVKIMLK
jgi:hypothetical protein